MSIFLAALPRRHLLLLAALAAFLLAGSSAPRAQSEPDGGLIVGAHLLTAHLGQHAHQYRTVTPGLYVRAAEGGLTLGAFRNSHGRASAYAGWTWQHGPFALTAGAATGYPQRRVSPLLIPSVALPVPGTSSSAVRLALVPKPPYDGASGGVHLAWETRL